MRMSEGPPAAAPPNLPARRWTGARGGDERGRGGRGGVATRDVVRAGAHGIGSGRKGGGDTELGCGVRGVGAGVCVCVRVSGRTPLLAQGPPRAGVGSSPRGPAGGGQSPRPPGFPSPWVGGVFDRRRRGLLPPPTAGAVGAARHGGRRILTPLYNFASVRRPERAGPRDTIPGGAADEPAEGPPGGCKALPYRRSVAEPVEVEAMERG